MLVRHEAESITHAVIGGQQTQEFGISNDPEFFNILSDTLYKNKKMAMVREVLCNAWDAHIDAGCENTPVEVTVTHDKFVIRDRGFGIPDDLIQPIYAVYGNSTKKNDGRKTGGFGLGCKAPFCYADHFEVISDHKGQRAIYNMSKSSAKVGGRPGIVTIARFPTQERGLTVSIPLNSQDQKDIQELVARVARNGSMNLTLNNKLVTPLPFKDTFLVSTLRPLEEISRIYVRYGSVIYPVDDHAAYNGNYNRIMTFLNGLAPQNTGQHCLILQALPDSLGVTPSRESLSMSDTTIATLSGLLAAFYERVHKELPHLIKEDGRGRIQKCTTQESMFELLFKIDELPKENAGQQGKAHLSSLQELAETSNTVRYPGKDFHYGAMIQRAQVLLQQKTGHQRGIVQSYLRELKTLQDRRFIDTSPWFHQQVLAPLFLALDKQKGLGKDKLYVLDAGYRNRYGSFVDRSSLRKAVEYLPFPLDYYLPFLRNIVVLATRKSDIEDRLRYHPQWEELLTAPNKLLIYFVPRKDEQIDAAKAIFAKRGMTVVDMSKPCSWETVATRNQTSKPKRPVVKGYPMLSGVLPYPESTVIDTHLLKRDSVPRLEVPEFYVHVQINKNTSARNLRNLNSSHSAIVAKLWGDRGVIVSSVIQDEKLRSAGIPTVLPYVMKQLAKEMTTNSLILDYAPNSYRLAYRTVLRDSSEALCNNMRLLLTIPEVQQRYKLPQNLPVREQQILQLWSDLVEDYSGYQYTLDDYPEAKAALNTWLKIKPSPEMETLCKKITDNLLYSFMDIPSMVRAVQTNLGGASKNRTRILDVLFNVIEG